MLPTQPGPDSLCPNSVGTLGEQSSCLSCLGSQISLCAWQGTALVCMLTGTFQLFVLSKYTLLFHVFFLYWYPSEHPRPLPHITNMASLDKGNSSHTRNWFWLVWDYFVVFVRLSTWDSLDLCVCVIFICSSKSKRHLYFHTGLKTHVLLRIWLHCPNCPLYSLADLHLFPQM